MPQNLTPPTVVFGRLLVEQRRKIEKKASSVAIEIGLQPSNYSKIETGASRPPQDAEKLKKLGKSIGLRLKEEWANFYDLAAAAIQSVPIDLVEYLGKEKLGAVFLRTVRDKNLSEAEFNELIERLRK